MYKLARQAHVLITIGAISVFLLLMQCSFMPDELEEFFSLPLPEIERGSYRIDGIQVSYVRKGNPAGTTVVFVHGSPGSWEDWKLVIVRPRLTEKYDLIAVDRPGWGQTSAASEVIFGIDQQSRLLQKAMDLGQMGKKVILVGHSLGGPIALRMAARCPDMVAAIVLLSPSLDPDLDAVRWYNRLADYKLIKILLPKKLAKSNDEIMVLPEGLRKLGADLSTLKMPVVLVQGQKDELVHPDNAKYARAKLTNARYHEVILPNFGHLIPHLRPAEVVLAIEQASQMVNISNSIDN